METRNCAIFMDYDNIWISMETRYQRNIYDIDFIKKIKNKIIKGYGLPKTPKIEYNISKFIAYANFDNGRMQKDKHQTKLQKLGLETRHCMNGKNMADILICNDSLKSLYENNFDSYFFITCDKDILPIINTLKSKNKEVILIPLTLNIDWDVLSNYADRHIWLEELLELEYIKPKLKEKLNEKLFLDELKNQLHTYKNLTYASFSYNLENKFNTDRSKSDEIKNLLISKNKIEFYSFEVNGKIYRDGLKLK